MMSSLVRRHDSGFGIFCISLIFLCLAILYQLYLSYLILLKIFYRLLLDSEQLGIIRNTNEYKYSQMHSQMSDMNKFDDDRARSAFEMIIY